MLKIVIFNTSAQIIGKVITASTTLLITLLIAKSLGPTGYGDFTKIFVFIGYFYSFADFGLNNIYIKLVHEDKKGTLIRYLVGLRLIISVFLAFLAISISLALPYNAEAGTGFSPAVKVAIAVASLTIITQALFTAANAYFQNKLRYELSAISAAVGTLVVLASVALSTLFSAPLIFYVAAYVFGGMTFVLISYSLIFIKFKQKILPLFSKTQFLSLTKHSWPVAIALIFNIVYFRLDVLILSYTRSTAEVGIYGLAFQFFEASLTIPIFFANALYPLLAKLHRESATIYKSEVKKWFLLLIGVSILQIIALGIVSYLIPILYDTRFAASQNALLILSLGVPFFFISALLWHLLLIHNRQKYLGIIYFLGAVFNFVLNMIYIPQFGYIAASWVTVVSEVLITIFLAVSLYRAKLMTPFSKKTFHNS